MGDIFSFRIYIYTAVESEETIEDMMDNYNIALNDELGKKKLLEELLTDYMLKRDQVRKMFKPGSNYKSCLSGILLCQPL